MPAASDIILDWIAKDGYSLSEAGWIRPPTSKRRRAIRFRAGLSLLLRPVA